MREQSLNHDWRFRREEPGSPFSDNTIEAGESFPDGSWERVCLPHTARIDDPSCGPDYFRGICWYRRVIPVETSEPAQQR